MLIEFLIFLFVSFIYSIKTNASHIVINFRSVSQAFKGIRLQGRLMGLDRSNDASDGTKRDSDNEREFASLMDHFVRMHGRRYARRYYIISDVK